MRAFIYLWTLTEGYAEGYATVSGVVVKNMTVFAGTGLVPFEVEPYVVQNRDGEDINHNVLISNYGPVLLLDILSNTAVPPFASWLRRLES
jgi:hypothetical protein